MTDRHTLKETGQVALGHADAVACDVVESDAHDHPVLELTLTTTDRVPPTVAKVLAERGLGVDPDASGTQADHMIVVAY